MNTRNGILAAAIFVSILPSTSRADIRLDDLTVVATRLDADTFALPNHVTIITANELKKYPSKTLPEILSLKSGIITRSSFGNNAARSVIDIRGFGAAATQNTLVLLDGKRLNDIDQSTINYSAIPIENIERIEIVRGAGGVLYGDGAVGGVINIVTRRTPADTQAVSIKQRYASYDTWQTDAGVRYGTEAASVNLFANRLSSDGYRDNNALEQYNIQGDVRMQAGTSEFFSKFGYSDQALGLPGNRTVNPTIGLDELRADRRGTNNPDDIADEQVWFFTLGTRGVIADKWHYIIDGGVKDKLQVSDLPSTPRYIDTELQSYFFSPRLTGEVNTAGLTHRLSLGVDLYHYEYDSEISGSINDRSQPVHVLDISQQSYAIYLNDLIRVTERTSVNIGGRYQHVAYDAADTYDATAPGAAFDAEAPDVDRADNQYFFSLGLKHFITPTVSGHINVGQSIRVANVDDINQVSFPPPAFAAVREFSDLKAQRSRHLDFGFQYETSGFSFGINAYFMRLRNEIHFNPVTFLNVNLDPTKRRGVEFNLDADLTDRLHTFMNYTLTRSEFSDGPFAGNEVPLVPQTLFSAGFELALHQSTSLIASWSYVGEKFFDNDQNNTFGQKIPGYSFLDLGLNSRIGRLDFSLSGNNLLDEQAFDSGVSSVFTPGVFNTLPLPERNFGVSVSYGFD